MARDGALVDVQFLRDLPLRLAAQVEVGDALAAFQVAKWPGSKTSIFG
jgi:hypothetical protein